VRLPKLFESIRNVFQSFRQKSESNSKEPSSKKADARIHRTSKALRAKSLNPLIQFRDALGSARILVSF
jgi:hypothetical protein